MSQKRLIVISSREEFNTQGNSHMHYLDELRKENEVIFINPSKRWPTLRSTFMKIDGNLTLFQYANPFPLRFFKALFAKWNDLWNARRIKALIKGRPFILWQFDPYSFYHLGDLKPEKLIYFPLDYYGKDPYDSLFAKRSDLLVCVNNLFVKRGYDQLNSNILSIPHGFSEKQALNEADQDKVRPISSKYGQYFIFTGALTQWNNYDLLTKTAQEIFPMKLLILGEQYYHGKEIEELERLDNVTLLGHIDYTDLKYYIANAIACLVVYDFEDEASRNPIKITDYLSQNKLVINTSRVKENEPLEKKALYTANNSEEFLEYVRLAKEGKLKIDLDFIEKWKKENAYPDLIGKIWSRLD